MNIMDQLCSYCNEYKIIIDPVEGTYVCTECGLVKESNIWVDQGNNHAYYDDIYDNEIDNEIITDRTITNYIWNESQKLFEELQKKRQSRGDNKKGLFANCLIQVCNLYNVPRSIREVSEILDIDENIITKTRKQVDHSNFVKTVQVIDDDDFSKMIPRYLNKLRNFEIDVVTMTKNIKDFSTRDGILEGKSPHTRLVTFIYHLIGDKYTKKDVCSIFGISTVTLNKSYKEFISQSLDF